MRNAIPKASLALCLGLALALLTAPGAGAATFSNTTTINIPDSGTASPYPSSIAVSGLAGTITDVNVKLNGYTHTNPDDVGVVLVTPGGDALELMSRVGGSPDAAGVNLTIDDSAATLMPDTGGIASGAYKPTSYAGQTYPAPGPSVYRTPAPTGLDTLSAFIGTPPNGTWKLFVIDSLGGDVGQFAGGWSLEITAAVPTTTALPAGIPDGPGFCTAYGTPLDVTFPVTGLSGVVSDTQVRFTGTHTWVGDLDVQLLAPGGAPAATVFSRTGATGPAGSGDDSDLGGAYSFLDGAPAAPTWGAAVGTANGVTAVPPGSYRASTPGETAGGGGANALLVPAFASVTNPNGTWTLRFRDKCLMDTGTVTAASLSLQTTIPTPPAVNPPTTAPGTQPQGPTSSASKRCKKKKKKGKGAAAAKGCKKKKKK